MRDGRRQVAADAIEVLLQSVDVLARHADCCSLTAAVRDEARVKAQYSELQRVLADKHSSDDAVADPVKPASAVAPEVQPVGWKISFRPHPHLIPVMIRCASSANWLMLGETSVNCVTSPNCPLHSRWRAGRQLPVLGRAPARAGRQVADR